MADTQPLNGGRGGGRGGRGGGAGGGMPPRGGGMNRPAPPVDVDQAGGGKLAEVTNQVDAVKVAMKKNLEMAIDRGEKLEEMEHKSQDLLADAHKFETKSNEAKKMMWRRNMRLFLFIGLAVAIVIAILVIVYAT